MNEPSGGTGPGRRTSGAADPEIVLAQALRAKVGGRAPTATGSTTQHANAGLTTVQVLLIAAIIGLLIGAGIALLQLAG